MRISAVATVERSWPCTAESVTLYANDAAHYDLNESVDPDSWDAGTPIAIKPPRPLKPHLPRRLRPRTAQRAEVRWSDLDANGSWYNVPARVISGRLPSFRRRLDPTAAATGVVSAVRYIFVPCENMDSCPIPAAPGITSMTLVGLEPGMGGCNPWWNSGYYPGPAFGEAVSPGYRLPHRPISPRGPVRGHPVPVIVVNRRARVKVLRFHPRSQSACDYPRQPVAPIRPIIARGGENPAGASADRCAASGLPHR